MKKLLFIITGVGIALLLSTRIYAQEIFDAIRSGDLANVKELIEKDPRLLKAKNARSSTLLHVAADVNNAAIVRYLIEKGADIRARNDNNSYTPLMFAGLEAARVLVEKGADVNYETPYGLTVLFHAFDSGKKEVAEYLLEAGAKIPVTQNTYSTLLPIRALRSGSQRYLEIYLQQGFDPLVQSEAENTLLHYAAGSQSIELVNRLIDLGLPINKKNIFGWTALHSAAYYGSQSVVELLIHKGLDKNSRTIDGKSPYNLAAEAKKTETANYLLSLEADLSAPKFPELTGEYFSQPKPGKKAVPFAPVLFASNPNMHFGGSLTFAPDGKEAYWSIRRFTERIREILVSKLKNGKWTMPAVVSEGEAPFISPDGEKFYFIKQLQTQEETKEVICVRNKIYSGWSEPYELPDIVNSIPAIHWQASVDKKGTLFFGTMGGRAGNRIYCSEFKNGTYRSPRIVESLRDLDSMMPYIAPDGSYLIFPNLGSSGISILFRNIDGAWSKERKIVDILRSKSIYCPMVTRDGKYLFFLAYLEENVVPYWMDASFIDELRKKELRED